jgi:predicted PurR-regulated permease PerM
MPRDEFDDRPAGGNAALGRAKVSGPAIMLIIGGVLSMLLGALVIFCFVFSFDALVDFMKKQRDSATGAQKEQLTEQIKQMEENTDKVKQFYSVLGGAGILLGLLVTVGGFSMKGAKSYGWSMAASVLALIPVVNCCCVVTMPAGLWGLITLMNPDVKAAFARGSVPARGDMDPGFDR